MWPLNWSQGCSRNWPNSAVRKFPPCIELMYFHPLHEFFVVINWFYPIQIDGHLIWYKPLLKDATNKRTSRAVPFPEVLMVFWVETSRWKPKKECRRPQTEKYIGERRRKKVFTNPINATLKWITLSQIILAVLSLDTFWVKQAYFNLTLIWNQGLGAFLSESTRKEN